MKAPYKLDDDGHAIDRFIERHLRCDTAGMLLPPSEIERAQARVVLDIIRATAEHVEDITDEGQEIWRGRGGFRSVLLVVRDGVVRTVLKPGSRRPSSRRRTALP